MCKMDGIVITLFSDMYGRNFIARTDKLREECLELVEAIDNLSPSPKDGELDRLIDEMSDVEAVMTHVCDLLHITRDSLLEAAIDKVSKRVENPNYKRDGK